jgi:hypothetical protein
MLVTSVKGAMELDASAVTRLTAAVGQPPRPETERKELAGPWSHSGQFQAYVAGRPEELARIQEALDRALELVS